MENIGFVFQAIRSVWDNIFVLPYPGIGMTFKQLIIGSFIAGLAIYLLKWIFGIGASITTRGVRDSVTRMITKGKK